MHRRRAAFLLPDVFVTRGTATFVALANRLNPTHCSVLVWRGSAMTSTALYLSAAVSGSNMLIFPTQIPGFTTFKLDVGFSSELPHSLFEHEYIF